jgi:dipeptide transport system substrate-binding protein
MFKPTDSQPFLSQLRSNYQRFIYGLLTLLLISACQYKNNEQVKDDVLVYCSEGTPETFNPQLSTSGVTFDASSRTLYNRLVEFKPGTTVVEPALATAWRISNDGKTYTFKLRENVSFHQTDYFNPQRFFNADDVIFSFQKQWIKNHPFYQSKTPSKTLTYHYFRSMGLANLIESINKIDLYTVEFRLKRAESPFLATLAMDFASILSAEYGQQLIEQQSTEKLNQQPIGTGPFQLVRYQPDAFIRYKAHTNYWRGKQAFSNLVFAITPDPSLRFARVVAGECDLMANPLPIHLNSAEQFTNTEVISDTGLNTAFLTMNTKKAPFDNNLVRVALNHAINKDTIIKAVYQQTATPAIGPIPPSLWAHNKNSQGYEFDPTKAKQLLKEAGYPNGFNMSIWAASAQRAYNPNAKKMAELIQQDLAQIGVSVEITTFELGTLLSKVRQGNHHAALMGWTGDNGDPDNFFTPLLSCASTITGTNSAFWCNPWFNQLIFQARAQAKIKDRQRLYFQAQAIFKKSAPWVPIAHASQHLIFNPRVKNLALSPIGGLNLNGVYLEQGNTDE